MSSTNPDTAPIVIIGGGPAAWKFCQQFRQFNTSQPLVCISEEAFPPYNRVQLGRAFSESHHSLFYQEHAWYTEHDIDLICNDAVEAIQRQQHTLTTRSQRVIAYSKLIFATGSTVSIPPIPGIREGIQQGTVIPYRKLEDVQQILSQITTREPVAVLGGGLLGVEAAGSLLQQGHPVKLVEAAPQLLPQLLSPRAATFLEQQLTQLGIEVATSCSVEAIHSNHDASVTFDIEGSPQGPYQVIILATGIRPRDELAAAAGLQLGAHGGIAVNPQYQSSDPSCYAIGECASQNDQRVGLVAPVMQMASELAHTLAGHATRPLEPNTTAPPLRVQLKVAGLPLSVIALEANSSSTALSSFETIDPDQARYQSLRIDPTNNTLLSATLIGDTRQQSTLARLTGQPGSASAALQCLTSPNPEVSKAAASPATDDAHSEILCHCEAVTTGSVIDHISKHPEHDLATIKKQCRLAQGCGSCEPELHRLYQQQHPERPEKRMWGLLLTRSIRSLHLYLSLAAATFLLFFAVSGYAMNHREDLGLDQTTETETSHSIPGNLLASSEKQQLLETMKSLGARGSLTEFDRDEEQISISFQSAGRYFEAFIEAGEDPGQDATAEIVITDSSFLETLGEIHRSESHDENSSSLFIDIMSFLMAAVSLTGIALFFRMATRKNIANLLYVAASAGSAVWVYFLFK